MIDHGRSCVGLCTYFKVSDLMSYAQSTSTVILGNHVKESTTRNALQAWNLSVDIYYFYHIDLGGRQAGCQWYTVYKHLKLYIYVCTLTCFHKKIFFVFFCWYVGCLYVPSQTENDLDLLPFAGHGYCWSVGQKGRVMS